MAFYIELFSIRRECRICWRVMQSQVASSEEEDYFFAQLRSHWKDYLRGNAPFDATCIQFRMACYSGLYSYSTAGNGERVCRRVSDIFDELVEENIHEIYTQFQISSDFAALENALDQLCRGSNNIGRTARVVYRHKHHDLTQGLHRNLHNLDSTSEKTILSVGNAVRKECSRRLMPLAVSAYQQRIRTCLMSLHARSATNNSISRILVNTDLRVACNGVLWKDGAQCLHYLHSSGCGSDATCTLGSCPHMNLDWVPEYFKPSHWVK